jgi:hypothetical protein
MLTLRSFATRIGFSAATARLDRTLPASEGSRERLQSHPGVHHRKRWTVDDD